MVFNWTPKGNKHDIPLTVQCSDFRTNSATM